MKSSEFMKSFAVLMEIYGVNYSEATIEVYYEILKDISPKEFEISVKNILKERVFTSFPKPAEFLQLIYGKKEELEESLILEAVSKFRQCLKKGGSIETDDRRLVWTIKRMGGWDRCRNSNLEQINFLVNEFQKVYAELLKKEVPEEIDFFLLTNNHIISKEQGLFFPILKVKSEKKELMISG